MKIAVTPFNIQSIKDLSEKGAETFILGNDKYATRLVKSYSEIELADASGLIKSLGKEIYIQMNLIVHNDDLKGVNDFLEFTKKIDADGIIFGDLSVYMLAKKLDVESKLIYNPETLNTNYYDPVFWGKKGIKGIIISKEITLEDIKTICERNSVEIGLVGHGHLNMFHSRRPLISNFFKYKEETYDEYIKSRNLKLVEEIRNEAYPVFQDEHGTHIFRDRIMESYKEINTLENYLDIFIIDGIFKDTKYLIKTVENYQKIIKTKSQSKAEKISNGLQNTHDSGFLYKKTVYDKY